MQTVLVTGATSGIGEALVHHYARCDWRVLACGRNAAKLEVLQQTYQNLTPLEFDVTQKQQVAATSKQLPAIDVLILNAGNCEYIDDPMQFDSDVFERLLQVNLVSIGYCLEFMLPKVRRGGRLVMMSSSASYLPLPRATAYGASKAALNYMANTLRIELSQYDIGVSLICPGFVKTPLTDRNEFAMPMRVSAERAASVIVRGLNKGQNHIDFPRLFMWIMKFMALLPAGIWHKVATLMTQRTGG